MRNYDNLYNNYDIEANKILDDFIPQKVFDAHMHLFDKTFAPHLGYEQDKVVTEDYHTFMAPVFGNRNVRLNIIPHPDAAMKNEENGLIKLCDDFLVRELNKHDKNVGELMVLPEETVDDLEKRLVHRNVKGFKCYHLYSKKTQTWNCSIGEYLPESAWEIANKKKMCITLHMVRDKALADKDNLDYIINMSKKYPDAVLILAHAARSFASWTGIETVGHLSNCESVWFDFSSVCESPAMFQIIKKAGIKRCMWGSDFPINTMRGKAISLADTFYWIYQSDIDNFDSKTEIHNWLISTENLMAVRQACILAELSRSDIEDLFYNNAARLFGR